MKIGGTVVPLRTLKSVDFGTYGKLKSGISVSLVTLCIYISAVIWRNFLPIDIPILFNGFAKFP